MKVAKSMAAAACLEDEQAYWFEVARRLNAIVLVAA
jgi:hypothetical protein